MFLQFCLPNPERVAHGIDLDDADRGGEAKQEAFVSLHKCAERHHECARFCAFTDLKVETSNCASKCTGTRPECNNPVTTSEPRGREVGLLAAGEMVDQDEFIRAEIFAKG